MGTGHLKVHITKEVLKALDICQNNIIVICLTGYKSGGNTSHLFLDRNTGRHQRHGGRTDTGLGCGTIGFKCFRNSTNRIREFLYAWKYRNQSFFGQCAMADLAASRSSGRFCFSDRVGREIVMVHITFGCHINVNTVNTLCFGHRSQSSYGTDLSLSTGEHGRTVNSRKQIHFCSQRTNLVQCTAVRTLMIF